MPSGGRRSKGGKEGFERRSRAVDMTIDVIDALESATYDLADPDEALLLRVRATMLASREIYR